MYMYLKTNKLKYVLLHNIVELALNRLVYGRYVTSNFFFLVVVVAVAAAAAAEAATKTTTTKTTTTTSRLAYTNYTVKITVHFLIKVIKLNKSETFDNRFQ